MKKFILVCPKTAVAYKEIFPLIKNNQLWLGNQNVKEFRSPNGEIKKFGNICWFTNIEHNKRNTPIDLYKRYSPENYPKYDNYDAIECGKVAEIPIDYDGVIGVPITFLDKYCPEQFEIVGMCENEDLYGLKTRKYTNEECKDAYFKKFGKNGVYDLNAAGVLLKNGLRQKAYARILIRKRQS